MKYFVTRMRRFCGFIAGFVFYISGILKLLDPVGAGLVMDEYFHFLHIGFMDFSSKFMGTAFAFAEVVIGTALITGVWRKITGIAAIAFQGFFTLLTLLLVIFNPEMDCGCFGEAIHLTHLQTFIKNLVLIVLLACNFVPLRGLGRPKRRKYISFAIVTLSSFAFTVYSWMYIPMIDFTDYQTTARLKAAEKEDAEDEELYSAVFIYEKDGKQQVFDLEHLPDSTWTFVSTETILNEDAMEKTISLSFYDSIGDYHDSTAASGKVMVVSVYEPDWKSERWEDVARFTENAAEAGFRPIVLAADKGDGIEGILADVPDDAESTIANHLYLSDYKTLITLNRSNGGVTYFSDGYLIRKWARRNCPDVEELKTLSTEAETETMIGHSSQGSLAMQGFLLYVFAVMLLL